MQPHILCKRGDVGEIVFLPGDPARARLIAEKFDTHESISQNREFSVFTGFVNERKVSVCSTGIGAPSAAIAVEELSRIGARQFIRVGTCGSLTKKIDTGEIIIPTACVRLEGTSVHYIDRGFPAVAHRDIVNALLRVGSFPTGIVISTDAFYSDLRFWYEKALAVEMECSAIFVVASLLGLKAGAILAVDGCLPKGSGKEKTEHKGEVPEKVRKAVLREIDIAIKALEYL